MFIAAIGFDKSVIFDEVLRGVVLSAIESALLLMWLFRATALTTSGRQLSYTVARRFMEKMLLPPFKALQTSGWAIFKFHSEMTKIP